MQSIPGWPTDESVTVPDVLVTAGGIVREVEQVSVAASVGGTDVAARTGQVVWAPSSSAFRAQDTVVTAGVPRRGDRVSVSAGDRGARAALLSGKVERTEAEVPGGLVSDVMDDWDMLGAEVDLPPLLARMSPYADGGPLRSIGLTATWPTQYALSQCGFHATPPVRTGATLSASLNGSLWPEWGDLITSPTMPTFTTVPWGESPLGFTATYEGGDRSMADAPLGISFLLGQAGTSGWSIVTVKLPGTGNNIRLHASHSRRVVADFSVGGALTQIGEIPSGLLGDAEQVRFRWGLSGAWSLSTESGTVASGSVTVPSALRGVPTAVEVNVAAGSAPIGGVNVGYYTTSHPSFKRTARIDAPDGTLSASRAVVSAPAVGVLRERADAERARMWITADGVFQWRSRSRWGAGSPVAVIGDADLLGYSVGMDYDSTYSGVTVSHIQPRIEVRSIATILLFQGNRQVLGTGDVHRTFVEVPSDEDWPWIDDGIDTLGLTGDLPGFNRGRRSWEGAVRVTNDGAAEYWAYGTQGDYVSFSFESITARKWLHTTTVGTGLATDQTIETRSPDRTKSSIGVWGTWGEFNLPVIRGYARTTWIDEKAYAATSTTQALPRMAHYCSWWVQGSAVQRLTDWLAQTHNAPVLKMTGLSIVPDPRIEIGDVVSISDATYGGLSVRAVISGIRYTASTGNASMSLDVEVLSVTAAAKTYADVQEQASGSTYAQFQALIGAVTYEQQEA